MSAVCQEDEERWGSVHEAPRPENGHCGESNLLDPEANAGAGGDACCQQRGARAEQNL